MTGAGVAWGPINPDLQTISNISGCPMYYTPQKLWPAALGKQYFGNKKIFGVLRDPYERAIAQFRGMGTGEAKATCDVNAGVKKMMSDYIANKDPYANGCQMLPQSEFIGGEYGISLP